MAEMKVYPDIMIDCLLCKRKIPEAMCYEINMIVEGYAKKNFVPEVENWDAAKQLCPSCPVSYYRDNKKVA